MKPVKIMLLLFSVVSLVALGACKMTGDRSSESSTSAVEPLFPESSTDSEPEISMPEISLPELSMPEESLLDPGSSAPEILKHDAVKMSAGILTGASGDPAVNFGSGTRRTADGRSESALIFKERYKGFNADFIRDEKNTVYLTFDEGYENGYTAPILDVLKEKGVSAVFFVTGHYVKTNPDLVQRMIDEGHTVGNHTLNHPKMPNISKEKAAAEITGLHELVKENFGYEMTLFRFPEGVFNRSTLALADSLGYKSVFWSFAYRDWEADSQPDPDEAFKKMTNFAHDGAIYLLHAVSRTNADILGPVIDELRSRGYEFEKYPA